MTQLSPYERAARYAAAMPPAVAGSGGHSQTFSLAVALAHGFNLSEQETNALMAAYNLKCSPPWNERELKHKVKDAYNTPHSKPRGWLLDDNANLEPRKRITEQTVTQSGKFKVNLANARSVPEAERFTTEQLLRNCFKKSSALRTRLDKMRMVDGSQHQRELSRPFSGGLITISARPLVTLRCSEESRRVLMSASTQSSQMTTLVEMTLLQSSASCW